VKLLPLPAFNLVEMNRDNLMAISPVDGRYKNKVEDLGKYFSEYALIKYRVYVEIEYFIALCELPLPQLNTVSETQMDDLRKIHKQFTIEDAVRIKEIENITNHDVKAVEYFLKERFKEIGIDKFREFIHFGLTSQDANNTALPLSINEALNDIYYPLIQKLLDKLESMTTTWKNVTILAKTHG